MTNFFEKRDPWGNGMALWILLGMLFIVPIAAWSLRSITMENEVHNWVSSDNPQTQAYRWFESNFPSDEAVLFTWEGSSLDDPRIPKFIERISGVQGDDGIRRGGLKQVERVRSPQELLAQMEKYDLSRDEAIDRLQGVLIGSGQLLVRLTEAGRDHPDRVQQLLTNSARDVLGLAIKVTLPPKPQDTDGSSDDDSAEQAAAPVDYDLRVTWPGIQPHQERVEQFREMAAGLRLPAPAAAAEGEPAVATAVDNDPLIETCFFRPGAPIALAVFLSPAGLADRHRTLQLLVDEAGQVGIPAADIHMGGRPVAGSALNQEVLKAVWNTQFPIWQVHKRSVIGLSWLVGLVLAFWLLRNVRLAVAVLAVSYFVVLVSVAVVVLTGGSMNMVLVVMPTLLLVTTLSGSIHLSNYWRYAAAHDPRTAVAVAVKNARTPCIWACGTTALGLASLMTSSLTPVRDFGMYSAIGTLLSLVGILYCLPALLQLWPGTAPAPEDVEPVTWKFFGEWMARRHRTVLVAGILIPLVCTAGLYYCKSEIKVIRYFADKSRIVQDYNYIEENLTGITPVDVIVRFDQQAQDDLRFLERAELVRQVQQKIHRLPDISGTLSLADFLPVVAKPDADANVRVRAVYNAKSRTIEDRVHKELLGGSTNVTETANSEFGADDDALTTVEVASLSGTGAALQTGTERRTASRLFAIADDQTAYNAAGDELWRVTAQVSIMSDLDYSAFTKQLDGICQSVLREVSGNSTAKFRAPNVQVQYHPGASHLVTGMVPLFLATQEALLHSLVNSFLMAFGTIAAVLMLTLRNPLSGLLAMLPNMLPIGMVFGLNSWAGLPVDIGTLVTASVALGIAIDGTLHSIAWFRLGIEQGQSRRQAVVNALCHCGPAMWQTSLLVALGLLVLYPAELVLVSRFGWFMAALIIAAMMADLVLTPALLAGPLGYLIERDVKKQQQAVQASPVETKVATSAMDVLSTGDDYMHGPPKPHLDKPAAHIRRPA